MTVVGLLLLTIIVVLLRWTFSRGQSVVAARPHTGHATDYGLLTPIAHYLSVNTAQRLSDQLTAKGIRHTTVRTRDGLCIMVFDDDAEHARSTLRR